MLDGEVSETIGDDRLEGRGREFVGGQGQA